MEKFGLFDLIEKFGSSSGGKNDFAPKDNSADKYSEKEIVGTPPQLSMNQKMREFVSRHDAAVKEILLAEEKKKKKRKAVKKSATPSATSSLPPKRRGRPPKAPKK